MNNELKICAEDAGQRLDTYLAQSFKDYSRNYFSNLIKTGNILVNQEIVKPNYRLKENDVVLIDWKEKSSITLKPEKIDLDILFENNDVIVINKQPGLVVHPASGSKDGTLVNALLAYFPKIEEAVVNDSEIASIRPGLVHRLDKDTSGVMIIAKNARAIHSLSRQIQNRTIKKIYVAICSGWPKKDEGRLQNYLGRSLKNRKIIDEVGEEKGRLAISDFRVIDHYLTKNKDKISLIEFNIKTGRTHQIRAQAKLNNFPIIGDIVYQNKESKKLSAILGAKRQLLHSRELSITLPGDNEKSIFLAPIPKDISEILGSLAKQ